MGLAHVENVAHLACRTALGKGIGETGVDIFFRDIQGQWEEIFPLADKKGLKAGKALKLGSDAKEPVGLVSRKEFPTLVAAPCPMRLRRDSKETLEETGKRPVKE